MLCLTKIKNYKFFGGLHFPLLDFFKQLFKSSIWHATTLIIQEIQLSFWIRLAVDKWNTQEFHLFVCFFCWKQTLLLKEENILLLFFYCVIQFLNLSKFTDSMFYKINLFHTYSYFTLNLYAYFYIFYCMFFTCHIIFQKSFLLSKHSLLKNDKC